MAERDGPGAGGTRLAGADGLALLVVDERCRCLHASPDACRVLGVAREELLDRAVADLLAGEDRERFLRAWRGRGEGRAAEPPAAEGGNGTSPRLDSMPARGRGAYVGSAPSAREREVLGMLALGATDGQIARRLDLSPATVRTHVRNAKAKLGARTRAQAVAVAMTRRMIQTEPG